jgi:hypothetical protein
MISMTEMEPRRAQAKQHQGTVEALIEKRGESIHVDGMLDDYWPTMLAKMYTKPGDKLAEAAPARRRTLRRRPAVNTHKA